MTRPHVPEAILDAAHARSRARAARDWAEADRLKREIESAGWKIVDHGTDFALAPAAPPDIVEEGRVRYGTSASVPSRLEDAAVGLATIVIVATDRPAEVERALSALREHCPDGTQLVVVGDGPSAEQAAALEALDAADPGAPGIGTEVVWTSERLGQAAALNAGIRRAAASVVVLLDPSAEPTGDLVQPLVNALADETVAVTGPWGLASRDSAPADLRDLEAAEGRVDVIDGACLAFRRDDYAERGPLDENFRDPAWLDAWWSLVLREPRDAQPPRRALALADLPVLRHREADSGDPAAATRPAKRNFYRLLERFRGRDDLLAGDR
jgi:glycosyl transferase family 2